MHVQIKKWAYLKNFTMADNASESLPRIKEVRAFVKKASGGDQGELKYI